MFKSNRYKSTFKSLISFKASSENRFVVFLTEKEARRLNRKKEFKDLIFASNPYDPCEFKPYTIFKKCTV